ERTGKWRVSLDHLKRLIGIKQKSYEVYGNLKNRVIRPSIKELNGETDLNIELEEVKKGRQVTELIFKIRKKQNLKPKNAELNIENNGIITESKEDFLEKLNNKAVNFTVDVELFEKINNIDMGIYEEDKKEYEILALIEYTNKYAKKNHIGFLLHILKEKEKIYNNAGNPSIIENELNNHFKNSEVIPEWFEKKQKNEDRPLTSDINTEEMQELKDLLAKHSSTKTNS